MKIKIAIYILLALIILINIFIFANSFDTVEQSYEKSDAVTEVIESIVKDNNKEFNMSKVIRKSAHLFEFALMGLAVTLCLYLVKRCYSKRLYGFGCFYVLAIAVIDEFIQSFSDRTSLVSDVLLDFSGFLIGSILMILCIAVFNAVNKKRNKTI